MGISSRQPDAHQREVMDLCRRVERLFREIWPKAKRHPNLTECYSVATRINIVKVARKPKKSAPPTALKHGRLLLQHLPTIRQSWEDAVQMHKMESDGREIIIDQRGFDRCNSVLGAIEQTEHCVRAFLEKCTPVRQQPPNGPAFIRDAVQKTWASVRGAKVPKSVGPNDPLCCFVTASMALIGKHLSPATVSDMLRDRQRRKKSKRAKLR
jgi:hypothetical protein